MQSLVRCKSSSSASVPRAAARSYDASVSSGTSPGTPRWPMTSGGFPSRVRKCLAPAGAGPVWARAVDGGRNAKAAAPNIAPTRTFRCERLCFMAKPPSFAQHRLPQGPSLVFLSQFSDSRMTSGVGLPILPALCSGEAHGNRLERHRLLAHGETARASGQPACEGRQRKTSSAAPEKAGCSESAFRRRRHLFHSAGLSDPAASAVEWRMPPRNRYPSAGDRCLDVRKPDRQPRSGNPQDDKPGAIERCAFFPGVRLRWGFGHMINIDPVPDCQPHMGRSVQYILLDRPDDADRRRDHDADPPLLPTDKLLRPIDNSNAEFVARL